MVGGGGGSEKCELQCARWAFGAGTYLVSSCSGSKRSSTAPPLAWMLWYFWGVGVVSDLVSWFGGTTMNAPGIRPAPRSTSRPRRNHPRSGRASGFRCPGPWSTQSSRLAGKVRLCLEVGESTMWLLGGDLQRRAWNRLPWGGRLATATRDAFACHFSWTSSQISLMIGRFSRELFYRFACQSFRSSLYNS
jgi:hypothetical protein